MKEIILNNIESLIKQLELAKTQAQKEEFYSLMANFELIGEKSFKTNIKLKEFIKKENNL